MQDTRFKALHSNMPIYIQLTNILAYEVEGKEVEYEA